MAARTEEGIAVTATARKLAERIYLMLKHGTDYIDPGADFYEARYRQRVLRNLRKRAKSLGFELVQDETLPDNGASVSC